MKRILILLSTLLLAVLLCACASPTETDNPEIPTDEPVILNETSGITGVRTGSSIRYEDFGLTVTIPEGAVMNWDSDEQPASFSQLDAEIEAEGASAGCWADFETPEGPALVGMQVLSCEENMPDYYVMDYFLETYSEQPGVSLAERRVIQLGDFKRQNCFVAELTEDGTPVNTLIFDRVSGCYRIECTVNTYGYQGAEELARQLFSVDAPVIAQYETSGTVGLLQDDILRFEDYGVSMLSADDSLYVALCSRPVPQTFEALAASLEDNWYDLFWQDFESESGRWSVSINLTESGSSESDYLYWTGEYYKEELNASECEIITLPLGENEAQQCLLVTFTNADGEEENLLMLAKVSGDYTLICSVSTYNWKGAKEKAEELFRVDQPKPLPFCIEPSGFFRLEDNSVFGKTVEELHSILGPFATPQEFPWWGDNLSCFDVSCDGYNVTLLLNEEGRLYGIICENVEYKKYDTAFEAAAARFDNVYYYKDASLSSFFLNDKVYQFCLEDFGRFQFGGCDGGSGTRALCQRYLADPMTDTEIVEMADYIILGVLPKLPKEHAKSLLEFAANRSGGAEQIDDIELCEHLATAYWHLKECETSLQWSEKAAELGSQFSEVVCGNVYYLDYKKYGISMDCEKASEYYLAALNGKDTAYRTEAEDNLVELWYHYSDALSSGQLSKVEDTVRRIVEESTRFIPEVSERLGLPKKDG